MSLGGIIDKARDIGGDILEFGDDVVDTAGDVASTGVDLLQDGGEAYIGVLKFEADVARWSLDRALDGGEAVINFIGDGIDTVTHPGFSNPPSAHGLDFSETKGASNLAYAANEGEIYEFPDGNQWEVVDVQDDQETGFRAIALRSTDPADDRVIVAFAGSRDGADWRANIEQGTFQESDQYEQAVDFADKWKATDGDNVILTGHSLGGGLASYAAIETDLHATAVNAAPLAFTNLSTDPGDYTRITQYYVPGEGLSVFNEVNPTDVRPGLNIPVRGEGSILNPLSLGSNHSLDSVAPDVALPELVE